MVSIFNSQLSIYIAVFKGEIISICVALSWTVTALFAEVASKRIGSLPLNVCRMAMSLVALAVTLWLTLGVPYPRYADGSTWLWLLLSGVVGYVLGDYCLFKGYILIGSRFGQLFMTLSAPTAAITGFLLLGEKMGPLALLGMAVTLVGIGMSVLSKQSSPSPLERGTPKGGGCVPKTSPRFSGLRLKLPLKGVLYGCGAGMGQGVGLVLSKMGLQHYHASLLAHGLTPDSVPAEAVLNIPLSLSMPFAATMIRAIMGIIGFSVALLLFTKGGKQQLSHAIHDRKSMLCAFCSMMFGPFVGVSMSLLATLYTSTGIAQTLMALTPIFIIAPAAWLFHQKVTPREVLGALISVAGVSLFFV